MYKQLASGVEAAIYIGDQEYKLMVCEDNGKCGQDTYTFTTHGSDTLATVVTEAADEGKKSHPKWTYDEVEGGTCVRLWARPAKAAVDEPEDAWTLLPVPEDDGGDALLATASHEYWAAHWAAGVPELMVESRKNGFWLREMPEKMAKVTEMKETQAAVEGMDDATWRAQLTINGYCDVKAGRNHNLFIVFRREESAL